MQTSRNSHYHRPAARVARLLAVFCVAGNAWGLEPVPDRLVVLTFDDSAKSHFTVARPVLKDYGFGATFFITEGFDFKTNKTDYMTWTEIAQLHRDGFEIGNHTRDHLTITDRRAEWLPEQLQGIADQCEAHGIPAPVTFAWPANSTSIPALQHLTDHGIQFARRGGSPEFDYPSGRGVAMAPTADHPLLIPSAGDARPDWKLGNFINAVEQAKNGKIAVIQFHGVPDTAHTWVNTPDDLFRACMKYLAIHNYQVIAMRDLAKYVDPKVVPDNPEAIIQKRRERLRREEANSTAPEEPAPKKGS